MDGLIIAIVILGAGLIGYIYYQNRRLRSIEQDKSSREREAMERLELERVKQEKQEKQEKQRQERERALEAEARTQLRQEISPVLETFLAEQEWQSWTKHMGDAEVILEGRGISVQELLQHNVVRRFPDGSAYRVGLIKQIPGGEYSFPPEKVEALQEYFICFLEFLAHLKSKGIAVNKLQLHKILQDEILKKDRKAAGE